MCVLNFQDIRPEDSKKMCIVIDLDETLVHSSFKVSALNIITDLAVEVSQFDINFWNPLLNSTKMS